MIRKNLKKTSKNEKLRTFTEKYKIPSEYLAVNRKMVSRAVLLGLFIALIPIPFQMLVVLVFVPFFKFNVPIGFAMCWLSNPLTTPPMLYVEYITGSFLLGIKPEPVEMSVAWFSENIDNIVIPLYAGTAIYSVIGSLLAYWAVNHFWKSSVYKDKKLHRNDRNK